MLHRRPPLRKTQGWDTLFRDDGGKPRIKAGPPAIDSWGNLTNRSGVTGKTNTEPLNCQANTSNQLMTCSYAYDAAGNMTANGTTSYVYDAENRMVWTNGTRYIYDGDGQRVEKCAVTSATMACPTSGTSGTLYWRGPLSSDALAET